MADILFAKFQIFISFSTYRQRRDDRRERVRQRHEFSGVDAGCATIASANIEKYYYFFTFAPLIRPKRSRRASAPPAIPSVRNTPNAAYKAEEALNNIQYFT